ncbi:MAG: type I DNA topoisomerase [Firmicutes bacterium HGW-Firmicutes-9]|jgi:DNA topoisomerase-1|nr:MAG: type I DNA topoisomerase [Firmicutes bacterium HGW-Firmicutes-9]
MSETLVIVESPAKAKTIGKFLGSKYKVVASNGHVRDLPKSQLGVKVEQNFEPKYITLRGRGDVLERIRKEAKSAEKVFLATDPDREGEAISWHLAQVLNLDEKSKCRIVFNEITSNAVKNSIKGARAIDMRLVNAQQARRILDRLVGYEISPILWRKVRKGLSAGRVQSVATRIICDREGEIRDFVPEEYWNISAKLREINNKKTFDAKYYGENGTKRDLCNEADTKEVLARIQDQLFTITEVKEGVKSRHPAPPFTTSSLQQEASRKLGFTTKRTMMIAQQLYEGIDVGGKGAVGLISYIRTDSVRIASEAQQAARAYIGERFGSVYVPEKPNFYKGRDGAQDAHEAIRPTSVDHEPAAIKDRLTSEQFRLYKLIYERFLASQMTDATFATTQVTLDCAGATFRANGIRTIFDGFTVIYTEGRDDAQEKETSLPELTSGETCKAEKIDNEQKFTQPPPRYTEATLVKALEEKGIGRPSTYSPTISTIVERGYIAREKKQLVPTELGFVVNRFMMDNFDEIVDVQFTAGMENQLDDVEEDKVGWADVLSKFYGPFHKKVEVALEKAPPEKIPDEVSDVVCEKCGAMMVYKIGRFGKFLACPNFPTCRNTKAIVEKIDVPCPKCGAALIKRKSKRGKAFYGCERYPECDFVSWDKPTNIPCPQCGGMMVQKIGQNGSYIACINKECGYIHRNAKKNKDEKEAEAE